MTSLQRGVIHILFNLKTNHLGDNGPFTKLEKAKDFKAKGTKFFSDGKYVQAIHNYRKIFDNLEGEEMVGANETERKNLVQAGRLNIALCWMKLEVW